MAKPELARWLINSPELFFAFALFAILMVHGATIGLTDDEAYYWVLAQKPALGYAYHPPMVAWLIALSQALVGPIFGAASAVVVRLPAALCSAFVLTSALGWLKQVGVGREKIPGSAGVIVSLAGLFALSWMMVPDLPLFLGWMLVFRATWNICFGSNESWKDVGLIFIGTAVALLSKYSAVLLSLSSLIAILIWAPRERRLRAFTATVLGGVLAAIPILLWNMSHEWASILYQIRDRHEGGSFSLVRWLRFWAIELFAGGPALIIFSFVLMFRSLKDSADKTEKFLSLFAAPVAVVFCLQPLWADFKPHWALVVWWPMVLGLALAWAKQGSGWARWQTRYGLTLGAVVLVCCHVPVVQYAIYQAKSEQADPRLDVTNDLYGWQKLGEFLRKQPGNEDLSIPVLGSRYQTASQAWFALGAKAKVSMLPLDVKSRDEWPNLSVSKSLGPDWSELTHPIFFVADNRYDAAPEFPHSHCNKAGRVQEDRAGYPAKWIDVWRCEPM
jgi:4-amino-4-deoxy-L-arabinose transferase-like glycosyltransferase